MFYAGLFSLQQEEALVAARDKTTWSARNFIDDFINRSVSNFEHILPNVPY